MKNKIKNKRYTIMVFIIVLMFAISGCKVIEDTGEKISQLDADMDKKVSYTQSLKGFDEIELHVNLTVSEVKIQYSDDDEIQFNQKSNRDELLAKQMVDEVGDTLKITYENEGTIKIISGSQKSEASITIPKGTKLRIISNVDVGDMLLNLDELNLLELEITTNVGKIQIESEGDQKSLSYVKATTNVGEVGIVFDGEMNALETLILSADTGSVSANLNGVYKEKLDVDATTNVGEVNLVFKGDFDQAVVCAAQTDVGGVTIEVPENHEIKVEAKTSEFTSNFEIKDMSFTKSKSSYLIEGDLPLIEINLDVSVGDALLKYSK